MFIKPAPGFSQRLFGSVHLLPRLSGTRAARLQQRQSLLTAQSCPGPISVSAVLIGQPSASGLCSICSSSAFLWVEHQKIRGRGEAGGKRGGGRGGVSVRAHKRTRTPTHAGARTHARTDGRARAHTHTHTHTHTRTHARTHTHTHTHTHTTHARTVINTT